MSTGLEGKTALVTGGTSGIGRAIVERLRGDGMRVVFTGRNELRGVEVARSTGAVFIAADATDRAMCDRSVRAALESLGGRIDLLVANAGMVYRGSLAATPEEVFKELIEVNLTASFRYSRACFSVMADHGGGVIVQIASDTAIHGIPLVAAYSITKAGLVALSELLASDGAPHGIRSNVICPGSTHPGMKATPRGYEQHAESVPAARPDGSGRNGTGEDVAALVAWLASPQASHVSGATIRVDGAATAATHALSRA